MKTRVMIVEWRNPTKSEKGLLGTADTKGEVSRIFIKKNQPQGEAIDTFFHEVAHAYIQWMGHKMDAKTEEKLARLVGNVVEPCFRRYL